MNSVLANISLAFSMLLLSVFAVPAAIAGETPAAVVKAYYAALAAAKSPHDLDKYLSKRNLYLRQADYKQTPPAKLPMVVQFMRLGLPAAIKVTSEKMDGGKAKVAVAAIDKQPMQPAPKKSGDASLVMQKFGVFFLVDENKEWKIDAEQWDSQKDLSAMINPHEWDVWMEALGKMPVPPEPVQGKLDGVDFRPATITLGADACFGGTWLEFKQGGENSIAIGLSDETMDVSGKTFEILDGKLSWPKKSMFNIILQNSGTPTGAITLAGTQICAMKLKFGQAAAEGTPGQILLRMSRQPEVSLSGTFVAKKPVAVATTGSATVEPAKPIASGSSSSGNGLAAKDMTLKYIIMDTAVFSLPDGKLIRLNVGETFKGIKLESIESGTVHLLDGDSVVDKRLF